MPQLQLLRYLYHPHYPVYVPIRNYCMMNKMRTRDSYNRPELYVHKKATNNNARTSPSDVK